MADNDNQNPGRVGRVGGDDQPQQPQQHQQPQQPQQPVQRGMPGVPPPPVPTQEQVAQVMREMAERQQRDMQIARARAQEQLGENSPPENRGDLSEPNRIHRGVMDGVPDSVARSMPPEMSEFSQPMSKGDRFTPMNKREVVKDKVKWQPPRNNGVEVELTDVIITNIPKDGIPGESDLSKRIVLCLLSEILALREDLNAMASNAGHNASFESRISRLEGAMYAQASGMQQKARGVREQIEMLQMKGMSAEEIVGELNNISNKADDFNTKKQQEE